MDRGRRGRAEPTSIGRLLCTQRPPPSFRLTAGHHAEERTGTGADHPGRQEPGWTLSAQAQFPVPRSPEPEDLFSQNTHPR